MGPVSSKGQDAQAKRLPQVRCNQVSFGMAFILVDSHIQADQRETSLLTWGTYFHPSSTYEKLLLKITPVLATVPAFLSLALSPWKGALYPIPAQQPEVWGNSRQLSSSEPSLQSVSPSQYQCSAIQLPSLQRNSLSEHLRMSGGMRNGTAILREPPSLSLRV